MFIETSSLDDFTSVSTDSKHCIVNSTLSENHQLKGPYFNEI